MAIGVEGRRKGTRQLTGNDRCPGFDRSQSQVQSRYPFLPARRDSRRNPAPCPSPAMKAEATSQLTAYKSLTTDRWGSKNSDFVVGKFCNIFNPILGVGSRIQT